MDTTEKKSLEEETRRDNAITEAEFKIQESLDESEIVAMTTSTEGNITFCNKQLLRFLGLKKESIIGNNLFEVFIPDPSLKINQKVYSKISEEGKYKGALTGKFFNDNKQEINVRFNVIFLKDALNEVFAINLIGENVTAQNRVKKQLEKSNNQLTELFDNSYDLIQTFDHDGNFQFVNQAWTEKLGYKDRLNEIRFKDLVHSEKWGSTVSNLDRIIKGDNVDRFETVFVSEMGKKIFVSGRVNCSFDINGNAQFRGIFYDITERIRTEKAQSLYYKIADFNIEGPQLEILYKKLFDELKELLNVKNLSIQLNLPNRSNSDVPYRRSEFNNDSQLENQQLINDILSKHVIAQSQQMILHEEEILTLIIQSKKIIHGDCPKVWLGVQITVGNEKVGLLSIHSYDDRSDFGAKDLELLYFIASQISLAIERKINEEKITDQAARLNAIFESSSHQIWSVDNQYNLTAYNQNYAHDIKDNYGIKAIYGSEYAEERKKFGIKTTQFWENKYNEALDGNALNFENEHITPKGVKKWSEVFINPILKEDQSIEEVSVISNDITDKKLSALALSESESKFREIFESIQDIYFRCNLDGKVSMISPSSFDAIGIKPEDTIGKNITNFFDSEIAPSLIFRNLMKQHTVQNLEISYTNKKGTTIDFICNARVLFRNQNAIGFEGVARDISDLKKTNLALIEAKELAEKSLAIKEQFLANMSHEIRTPMNGIIGMIDLIGSTILNNEQVEYVQTIRKSSQTLLDILNDILDLSKIEAGKMQIKERPVHLIDTFQKLFDLFSKEALAHDITLKYNLSDKIPEFVLADETRLLQVLSNLVSNAIKFSDKNNVIDISLYIEKKTNNSYLFKVQVKDEGIGISPSQIDNLFINFNQLDISSSKVYAGTGLGLAISKELVNSMGGKIGVVSTPDLGSTFWFTFEGGIVKRKDSKREKEENMVISHEFETYSPRILVVDDNKVNRTVASQILLKSGCSVDMAESGKSAIEFVINNSYDLIFMDIQMPVMDGIETTKNIKALGLPDLPPIVAMTAYSMEEDRKKFMSKGLDDYLAKPIRAATIINKVKEQLHLSVTKEANVKEILKTEDLIINKETFGQLAKFGGPDLIESILSDFEIEAKELIDNSLAFFDKEDIEGIRKELHTLKGSAGTLGIEKLANQVTALELQLKSADKTKLKPQLTKIEKSFVEFQKNYKNILQM
jgi:PAS domain S-box-containing protein